MCANSDTTTQQLWYLGWQTTVQTTESDEHTTEQSEVQTSESDQQTTSMAQTAELTTTVGQTTQTTTKPTTPAAVVNVNNLVGVGGTDSAFAGKLKASYQPNLVSMVS